MLTLPCSLQEKSVETDELVLKTSWELSGELKQVGKPALVVCAIQQVPNFVHRLIIWHTLGTFERPQLSPPKVEKLSVLSVGI